MGIGLLLHIVSAASLAPTPSWLVALDALLSASIMICGIPNAARGLQDFLKPRIRKRSIIGDDRLQSIVRKSHFLLLILHQTV
jgi:hypothetical protein